MQSAHPTDTLIKNRYRTLSLLGRGGSGITYQAEDTATGRYVALKALSLPGLSDWKKLELFEREAQVLASLNHPSIPKYIDYFQIETADNCFFYIVQEVAEGKSLAKLVAADERFSEAEARRIALEILKVLQYLHGLNPPIIHRDIKPQNIIRGPDGRIFLVDFGSVQTVYRDTMAFGSTVVGTYGYMAPEQFRGQAYPATDLYGLGATLLNLLTHQNPGDLPQHRLHYDFRSYVTISDEFADWLDELLEPLVEDRFGSASRARSALSNPKCLAGPTHCSQQPRGSLIQLTRNRKRLFFEAPPGALKPDNIGNLLAAVFWSGFGLFMVRQVIIEPIWLEAPTFIKLVFVLPPMVTVALVVGRYLNRALCGVSLEITKDRFTLTKKFLSWTWWVHRGSSKYLKGLELEDSYRLNNHRVIKALTFSEGSRTYQFGSMLSRSEKKWLLAELQSFLQEHNGDTFQSDKPTKNSGWV
ncbi:MAG: serine/threonine-protein kinase [Cyanobacteria bacterium P01_G01_bin.38]